MSIKGISYSPGGALPTTLHDQVGGLGSGTRMPQSGPAAALAARAPLRAGDGAAAPRAALGKLTHGLGLKLESARVQGLVLNQVHSFALNLHGNYPASLLAKVTELAANGLANLNRDFRA